MDINKINECYKDIYIKKRANKYRHIQAPNQELKNEQYKILNELESKNIPISDCAYGFVSKKNVIMNAKNHTNQEAIFNIDLKDFFDEITDNQIKNKLDEYHIENSEYLSKILTRNGHAVQGCPASPFISNIIFYDTDVKIKEFCDNHNIKYSRYADDMTFSGNIHDILSNKKEILNMILNDGWKISWRKVETKFYYQQQKVTGIVVNKKANISKKERNQYRGICHCIERDINNKTIKTENDLIEKYNVNIPELLGKLNYLRMANEMNNKYYDSLHPLLMSIR